MNNEPQSLKNRKPFFVHIPKTGGITVSTFLADNGIDVTQYPFGMGHFSFNTKGVGFGVLHDPKHWTSNNHFFFTVIRNPFDLLVSWYFHDADGGWCNEGKGLSFEQFIDKFIENRFYHRGFSTNPFGQLFDNEGNYIPEVTIRFESLTEGLTKMFECCELPIIKPVPFENKSVKKPEGKRYQDFYTPSMRARLEEKLRPQLEMFGYSFDGTLPGRKPMELIDFSKI